MTVILRSKTTLHALKYWVQGTPEIRLTKLLSDRSRTSIDVGANIGQFTWWMRRYAAAVVAYEPNPVLADQLRRSFGDDVVIRCAAASSRVGEAVLSIPLGPDGERIASASLSNDFEAKRTMTVACERIDDLAVGPIGYIKIDVEGHEMDVISGARRTIERDRPALLVELELRHHGGEISSKVAEICDLGYTGHFLHVGRLCSIDEFRVEMQAPSRLGAPADYINNFIFLPSGH